MAKVTYDISMSLDGFITGANPRLEAGLGDDGDRLHDWGFNSSDPRNLEVVAGWANIGAVVVGRNTYNLSILHWGANGPTGDARKPTIIVSHSVPDDVPANGVYTFVDTIDSAYEKAQHFAGDKNITIMGANMAQQSITLGLVDEIFIHIVPVLFGEGIRLFELVGGKHVTLETLEVIQTQEAIHTRFRVVK